MADEPGQRREASRRARGAQQALDALARQSARLAEGGTLDAALAAIADAAAATTRADVAVVRVVEPDGVHAAARAVAAASPALAAEIEGTRVPVADIAVHEIDDVERLPRAVRRIATRAGATAVMQLPVRLGGRLLGSVELLRGAEAFDTGERVLATLAAAQVALAVGAYGAQDGRAAALPTDEALELAGRALLAGSDAERTPELIVRLAAEATGARAVLLWRALEDGEAALLARFGAEALEPDAEGTARALREGQRVAVEESPQGATATVQLGRPVLGVLQLVFAGTPSEERVRALASFAVRAAEALRAGERSRELALELERTRALLAVVGQAIARLSLSHTLETAVEQVAERLRVDRVAVCLREDGRLAAAAERALGSAHVQVAERLLELVLGPFRARGMVSVEHAARDPRLARVRGAVAEAGIEAAHAVPLVAHGDVIGLLVVYPPRGRTLPDSDAELLAALAGQLAVAVENARLHEKVDRERGKLDQALEEQKATAALLRAQFEISRSFAERLTLEDTLDAVARTVVELLEVDAAVIRMPDERGESLVAQAIHVADTRMRAAIEPIFRRPQLVARPAVGRLLRLGEPLRLDAAAAAELGGSHELLVPFLEKGSTAAVLPIASQTEVLATLTVLSLDPARPITEETVQTGLSIARPAALALDNARLYQQQKQFADSMQRSLLPAARPQVEGLEVGDAYESSARLDVGGDLYDYLVLGEGRLAVVLGDVTGHGIDAAADMAMAKFVFRSLAREHVQPGEFLAHANEVVCGEVALGKFVTMLYLTIDAERGEVACASAGHPAPRLVRTDGSVEALSTSGLALGVERGQTYEEVRRSLEPGAAVVVYTDGVVEARRGRELYGEQRLERLLARKRRLPAPELALALLDECRRFSGGELGDDCAVVIVRRT